MRLAARAAALLFVIGAAHAARNTATAGADEAGALKGHEWAVDPAMAGENVPASGRSLFDFVVSRGEGGRRVYDVPFPFTALVARVERQLGRNTSGPAPLKAVLIPKGRSLQRSAGAPDYYLYPRVVVVADGEAAPARGEAGMLLKDRLYIGYHEKAAVVEVISYNEAAGRFEFQVVKDYRPGGAAQVYYANRAVCTACHQNAAPIFSRQLWDETNGNEAVAARLAQRRSEFYGIAPGRGVDLPYAIDNATDRANLYSAYQALWRLGCAHAGNEVEAMRCRAGLFVAALQYRLSGKQRYDTRSTYFEAAARALARSARERWPAGVHIPNPDLPNRNPEAGGVPVRDAPPEVLAAFDPLAPRPPQETWQLTDAATLGRLVAGLAEFVSDADVRRLDAQLAREAVRTKATRTSISTDCVIEPRAGAARRQRIDFDCKALQGRVYFDGGRVTGGTIDRLVADGDAARELRDIDLAAGRVRVGVQSGYAQLSLSRSGMRARNARGDAVIALELAWRTQKRDEPATGTATITVVHDFAPVHAAVEAMVNATAAGADDAFAGRPFRRVATLRPLFERLHMPPLAWCCVDERGMPPAAMEDAGERTRARPVALEPFYRYCATCHQTADRSPPNFLQGTPQAVATKLAHCAQRLQVRLSAWQDTPARRMKTPMPPANALAALHVTPEMWRASEELAALRAYVAQLLQAESGRAITAAELLDQGYENLRECLP